MKSSKTDFFLAAASGVIWGILATSPSRADESDEAFEKWQRQATADSAASRREAAKQLAEFPDRAVPALVKLLGDKDAGVRLAAAEAVRTVFSREVEEGRQAGRGPQWSGAWFLKSLGGQLGELTTRLKKLQTDEANIRPVAEQALRKLKVRVAAARVTLRAGAGTPEKTHLKRKVKVEGGELKDARGKTLARLSKDSLEFIECWSFSPDGRLLAVGIRLDGSKDCPKDYTIRGYLRLYDTATGDRLGEAGGLYGVVTHVAFDDEGKAVLYRLGEY